MSARLRRAQRVRRRADFVRIQASTARVNTRHLLLFVAVRADEEPARLGVVASRKVGGAVVRNRCKRLVREAFRLNAQLFPPGIDVVILVRLGTHELGLADVVRQLDDAAPVLVRRARDLRRSAR